MTSEPLHVLLTNDDGVEAAGLNALRSSLLSRGACVTAIAPDTDRSGMARAISFSRPVTVMRAGGEEPNAKFTLTGTPVDCVRLGLLSDLVPPVHVVISGINHGLNVGDDVTYSGTVGAALEAAVLDVPAIAFSQQVDDRSFRFNDDALAVSFDLADRAASIVLTVVKQPPPPRTVLNVNLPAGQANPAIVLTRPGRRYYERGFVEPRMRGDDSTEYYLYGRPSGSAPTFDDSPGTDFAALEAGHISISILAADATIEPAPDFAAWFDRAFTD
jgi:5'-nucleotidase